MLTSAAFAEGEAPEAPAVPVESEAIVDVPDTNVGDKTSTARIVIRDSAGNVFAPVGSFTASIETAVD